MIDDEFAGQGGSYMLDPETGKRTLVHRTAEADVPVAAAVKPAAPVRVPEPDPAPIEPTEPEADPNPHEAA